MFREIAVHADAPDAVRVFMNKVCELHLRDVHAMLRLPRPEIEIPEGCNFAISAVLMNTISGASVVLFEPAANGNTGRKFRECLISFYPWDIEPPEAIRDAAEGANTIYNWFRNPMVHAFGYQDPEPEGPVHITRFPGPGLTEAELEAIETSLDGPGGRLRGARTLSRDPVTRALQLNVEALYWGVREMLRRLTADAARMAIAEQHLRPILRQG